MHRHIRALRTITICLIFGLLLPSLASALVCRQDTGRPCTQHELTHLYLEHSLMGHVHHMDGNAILTSAPFTHQQDFNFSWIAPATHLSVVPHNGSLFVWLRITAACTNCTRCPDNALHAAKDCKTVANAAYDFSFVGYANVNSSFGIDGDVSVVPRDTQYELIESGYYAQRQASSHRFGIESMRAFTWDGNVYVAAVDWRFTQEPYLLRRVMTVQRVFPLPDALPVELDFESLSAEEQQWTPIDQTHNSSSGHVDYLFARHIEPHQLVQCNQHGQCVEAAVTSHAKYFEQLSKTHGGLAFKLGSNAVRVSDQHYGAILNGKRGKLPNQTIYHIAYLFEAKHPWSIVKVSKQPLQLPTPKCHPRYGFCFTQVTGLAYVDGKLVVSYSESESYPMVLISTVEDIFAHMEDTAQALFAMTPEMLLLAQEQYVSALVEGPRQVDQGARLNRVVEQHLSGISQAAKQEELTVYLCGTFI